MGCATCAKNKKSQSGVSGCKNNGTCGTSGCNKMNVFDWLGNMDTPPAERFEIVEIRFRNGRKEFYRNIDKLDLTTGEAVMLDMQGGVHLGHVSLQGELVRLQMMKKKVKDNEEIRNILRIASLKDLEKFEQTQERNLPTLFRTRQITQELKLNMKLSDVEFQADNTKATFYYSADDRVDFRDLIKLLASEFKVRVEMKQISLRQEAGRLGGIGSCGRELCCSTWLSDFKSVATSAARYQNLSLNPSKLSGQCGRLKCCLNYELETYMEELKDIPTIEAPLKTQKGQVQLVKTDIFKKLMWFAYSEESNWHPIGIARVAEILEMNKQGIFPFSLVDNQSPEIKQHPSNQMNTDKEREQERERKRRENQNRQKRQNNAKQGQNNNPNNTKPNNNPKQGQANNQNNVNQANPKQGQPNHQKKKKPFRPNQNNNNPNNNNKNKPE